MKQVYVEVVELETGEVERRLGPMSEAKADKVERGILRNLNTEKYCVQSTPVRRGAGHARV